MKNKLRILVTPLALLSVLSLGACFGCCGLGEADTDNLDVTMDTRGATISFWTGFGSSVNGVLEPLLERFTEKTGINVQYETKGGYSNLQTAINLAATTKEYANVAVGYPDHFAGYINQNIQLRLDGLIKNDHKRAAGKDKYNKDVDADGIKVIDYKDFEDDFVKENETLEFKKDGSSYIVGVPFDKSSEVMVSNSQFFDWAATQASLKDSIFIPKTWAEVKSVGVAVKNLFDTKNVYGKLLGSDGNVYSELPKGVTLVFDAKQVTADNFHLLSYDSTENLFITLVRQFGGNFTEVDPKETGKGYAVFADANNKDKTLAAMAMFRDLGKAGAIAIPASYNESLYCSTPFKNGQSLLNIGSTGGLSNAVGSFTVHANPIPQNGASQAKFVIGQGTNLALFNKGTDKEKVAAWKLIVYLSQQVNGEFAAGTGYFPTCSYAMGSDEYQDYLENAYGGGELLAQEASIINTVTYRNASAGWTRFTDPGFRGSSSIRTEVGFIPGYILFNEKEYPTDQSILDAVLIKIKDYIKA